MICAPGEKLRTASFSTPSAVMSLTTTPVVPAVVTRPSWPPLSLSALATMLPAPRSTRTPVRESLTDTPSSVTSWPPIAIPATRAPSTVELVIVAPLVVFSATIPRRPPVICRFCSVTFVVFTCMYSPIGWSAVVTSCTTQSVHRLTRSPPAPSPVALMLLTCSLFWPTTATP